MPGHRHRHVSRRDVSDLRVAGLVVLLALAARGGPDAEAEAGATTVVTTPMAPYPFAGRCPRAGRPRCRSLRAWS